MGIINHIIGSGISPFAAGAMVGQVTTLNSISTATSQGTAVLLGTGNGYIAICSSSGRAFQLPACDPGSSVTIYNAGATTASIYGQTGDNIGGAGANSASALANGKTARYTRMTATVWGKNLSA